MNKPIKIHPAADIFPLMTGEAFEELKRDIQFHGQREACVIYQDQLLDGRNRWRACQELGREPRVSKILETDFDTVGYVLSKNLHRRHLDESQRAMVAARVKQYYTDKAKERQKLAGKEHGRGKSENGKLSANLREPNSNGVKGKASDQAGVALKVSGRSVDHAATVLAKGSPELIQAVDTGKVAVSKAAATLRTKANAKPETPATTNSIPPELEKLNALWADWTEEERSEFWKFLRRTRQLVQKSRTGNHDERARRLKNWLALLNWIEDQLNRVSEPPPKTQPKKAAISKSKIKKVENVLNRMVLGNSVKSERAR